MSHADGQVPKTTIHAIFILSKTKQTDTLMKNLKIVCIMMLFTGVLWGCKKDEGERAPAPVPSGGTGQSVLQAAFANNVNNARQGFTMNASIGGQVMAAKGTRLQFDAGAFLHLDGTPVTGQVNVSVVEVLDMGDMIWLNKQTVGNDNGSLRLLRSGGAINVTATQGGNTLRVAQGGLIVRIPTEVGDPAMQLFMGTEAADGTLIWNLLDDAAVTVEEEYFDPTYAFPMDSLTWINCDYFPAQQLTTLNVTVPAGQSANNTQIWIAVPSMNGVIGTFSFLAPTFSSGFIPLGVEAVVVGLHLSNSVYYSSFTTVTVTANMTVPITFTETTLEQFQQDVNGL
jgi:hypothetical protein